jgi:hypothetical protein
MLVEVDDALHDVLREGFRAGILGRFRFKEAVNLLNDLLKNNLKDNFQGNLDVLLVLNLVGVNHGVANPRQDPHRKKFEIRSTKSKTISQYKYINEILRFRSE